MWMTSSMVEHLAYNEKVSGSNPLLFTCYRISSSVVRVLACHAKSREFKSRLVRFYFEFYICLFFLKEYFVC
jgi:hypothetical protein